MSFGDFWIQQNNSRKERLQAPQEAFGKERLDPKYAHLFDFFDKDRNGKLNEEEMEFLSYSLSAASGDNILTSAEAKASIFSDLGEEKADFLEFVKAISDAVKYSKTEELPNGEKRIITEYKNGVTDTIYYYPNGDFKFKVTEKKNFATIDNPETEFRKIGDGLSETRVKHNIETVDLPPDRFVYLSEQASQEAQLKNFIFQHFIDTHTDAQKAIDSVEWLDRAGNVIKESLEELGLGNDTNNLSKMEESINANKSKVDSLNSFVGSANYSADLYFGKYEDNFKTALKHEYSPEQAAAFQELTNQYQTATYLNQCIDLISRALRELDNYETDYYQQQTQMPGDNFNPMSHINTVVEALTQLFGDKEIAETMVNQMEMDNHGKFDISYLVEQLKEMRETNKDKLQEVLGARESEFEYYDGDGIHHKSTIKSESITYEKLKEKYIQEYKSMYNVDTVPEEVLDKVMTSKEIGGIVKIAIIMAIQMAITKQAAPVLSAGGVAAVDGASAAINVNKLNAFQKVIQGLIKAHGVQRVSSGLNFAVQAGFVPADIGLGLVNGMTSNEGLTEEKIKEIFIGGLHSAKYVGFGYAVTGRMSLAITQNMSKIGLGTRLFNGIKPIAKGQKVIKGADFVSKLNTGVMHYVGKGAAFIADGAAFGTFDALTGDLDLADATENAFKMQLELGVARHFLETLLGVKVHARIAEAKQRANLRTIDIIEDTNGTKPKYVVQKEGKTLFETEDIDVATAQVAMISQIGIENYQGVNNKTIKISKEGQKILDEINEIIKNGTEKDIERFNQLLDEAKQLENPAEVWAISLKIAELVKNAEVKDGAKEEATSDIDAKVILKPDITNLSEIESIRAKYKDMDLKQLETAMNKAFVEDKDSKTTTEILVALADRGYIVDFNKKTGIVSLIRDGLPTNTGNKYIDPYLEKAQNTGLKQEFAGIEGDGVAHFDFKDSNGNPIIRIRRFPDGTYDVIENKYENGKLINSKNIFPDGKSVEWIYKEEGTDIVGRDENGNPIDINIKLDENGFADVEFLDNVQVQHSTSGNLYSTIIPIPSFVIRGGQKLITKVKTKIKLVKDIYNEIKEESNRRKAVKKEKIALEALHHGKASPEVVKEKQDYVMRFFKDSADGELRNSIKNCSQQELAAKFEVAEFLSGMIENCTGSGRANIDNYVDIYYNGHQELNFVKKIIEDVTPDNWEQYCSKLKVYGSNMESLGAVYLSKGLSAKGYEKLAKSGGKACFWYSTLENTNGTKKFQQYIEFWTLASEENIPYQAKIYAILKNLGSYSLTEDIIAHTTKYNADIIEMAYKEALDLYQDNYEGYKAISEKLTYLAKMTNLPNSSFINNHEKTFTNLIMRGITVKLTPENLVIADAIAQNKKITPEEATKLLTELPEDINKTLELIKMGTSYDNAVYISNASPEIKAIEERILAVKKAYVDDVQTFSEKEKIIKNNKINILRSWINKKQGIDDEARQRFINVFENARNMEEFNTKYQIFKARVQNRRENDDYRFYIGEDIQLLNRFYISEQADFAVRFGKYDEKIICNKFGQTYVEYEKLSENYPDFDLTIRPVDDLQKCQQVAGTEAQKERLKELWTNKHLSYPTIIKLLTSNESYEIYNMLKTYKYFDYMSEKDFQYIIDGLVKNNELVPLLAKNISVKEITDKLNLVETQKLILELIDATKTVIKYNKNMDCTVFDFMWRNFPDVDKERLKIYDRETLNLIAQAIENSQHLSKQEITEILNNTDFSNLKQRAKCKELFKGDEKTVNQNFAKMLLCSDTEYISMLKRFQKFPHLLTESFDKTSLDFVMKMSDAEFEKYSTPIKERTAEPFDEEAYKAELENTIGRLYNADMSVYTQSRRAEYSANAIGYDTNYTFDPQKIVKKENTEIKHKTNEQLFNELERTGKIDYTIEDKGGMKPQITDEAVIKPEDIESLGQKRSAKSVVNIGNTRFWDKARRSRDIWQNFYFGNGYTLEGVNITVEKRPNGKLKVRISGKGEFDYERILTLGFSGQTDLARAAGRHGEGTKIITGNLLAGRTVDEVIFASGDWKLSQTRGETLLIDGRADDATTPIEKTLTKNKKRVEGNYLEFETTDEEFVKELVKAKDYFYSPDNPDWVNLDAESEYFGIKMLPKGQMGNCYVVQRYEVAGQKGLECTIPGMTLVFKQNPEAEKIVRLNDNQVISLDSGRNRVGLTKEKLTELISIYAQTLPEEELVNIIGQMSDVFRVTTNIEEHPQYFILEGLINAAHKNGIRIKFEGHDYIALDANGQANIETIKECFPNAEFVHKSMTQVGVRGTSSLHLSKNERIPKIATWQEQQKIQLLDKAIELISENLDLEHIGIFTNEEAYGVRYVFEKSGNDDPAGEAIVSGGKTLGHWIERNYLKYYSFYDVLATWMHEISHKVGGDGDYVFNKRLETIEHLITQLCLSNTNFAKKLDIIAQKYKEIGGSSSFGRTPGTAEELAQAVNTALEKIKHPEPVKDETFETSKSVSNPRLDWDEIPPDKEKVLENNHGTFIHPDKDITVSAFNFMGQICAKYIENKPLTRQTETQAQRLEQSIEELAQTGKLLIEIPPKTGNVPIKGSTEITNPTDRAMLGKPEKTNMLIIYNQHQEWSYEMAARDLWQNQNDGLNGTLDGAKLDIERQPNGKYKIKLSSDSEYNYFWLQYIAASNKPTNDNAGGFGEGAKMASRALLHSKAIDKISFASGKWKMDFTREEGVPENRAHLMNTLYENQVPVKGNYVEFETDNLNLVEAMIKAKDYFKHSGNPDFKDLTFENDDFGYRVLPPGQKGNMYYIQRYALKGEGELDGILDGLHIIFKKKLSRETLREIGIDDDVDRRGFTPDEIGKISAYFAKGMTDIQLMQAITDLERYMVTTTTESNITRTPEGKFVCGLIDEAANRNLYFDYNCKYVELNNAPTNIILYLLNNGYVTVDDYMGKVLTFSAQSAYEQLYRTKKCEPTIIEQQKLYLLNEALKVMRGWDNNWYIGISDEIKENVHGNTNISVTIRRDYLESADFTTLIDDILCASCVGDRGSANQGYNLTNLLRSNASHLMNFENQAKLIFLKEKYSEIK